MSPAVPWIPYCAGHSMGSASIHWLDDLAEINNRKGTMCGFCFKTSSIDWRHQCLDSGNSVFITLKPANKEEEEENFFHAILKNQLLNTPFEKVYIAFGTLPMALKHMRRGNGVTTYCKRNLPGGAIRHVVRFLSRGARRNRTLHLALPGKRCFNAVPAAGVLFSRHQREIKPLYLQQLKPEQHNTRHSG